MTDHKYNLLLVALVGGQRETILEGETSARKVRNVAAKLAKRRGRKVVIERDGKELPGGPSALDGDLYERWLQEAAEKAKD